MPPETKSKKEVAKEQAMKNLLGSERGDRTKTVLGISVALMALFSVMAVLDFLESLNLPLDPIDYVIFAMLSFLGPYGFYMSAAERHTREIETRLPPQVR